MRSVGTVPMRRPIRSAATARICSACAFESLSIPHSLAGSRTWNG